MTIIRGASLAAERRHVELGRPAGGPPNLPSAPDSSSTAAPGAPAVEPVTHPGELHPSMQAPWPQLGNAPSASVLPDPDPRAIADTLRQAAREEGFQAGHADGLAQGLREGCETGLAQGREEGQRLAQQAAEKGLERLTTLVSALEHAQHDLLGVVEDDAVEAIFAAVCQLCGELHADRDHLRSLYQAALAQVRDQRAVRIHAHPEDLAWLRSLGDHGQDTMAFGTAVEWVADESVSLGGCRVLSHGGELDARLAQQLERLRDTLVSVRAHRPREYTA